MARIEGDIDLTQNLDFYRKKPQKLLPANVSLKGRHDSEPKSEINIVSGENLTIQVSNRIYRNDTSYIYDGYYNNHVNTISYNNYNSNMFTISYSDTTNTANNITYTTRLRNTINDTWEWIDDGWTTIKSKTKKFVSAIEDKFKLWSSRPKSEIKDSLFICYCYECGASFLSLSSSGKCKKCLREEQSKEKLDKAINRSGSRFRFNHIQRVDYYDGFDGVPWNEKPNGIGLLRNHLYGLSSRNRNREYRYGIPWFKDLNTRIYDDYIDELLNGEKDYSSYLTNMGWIGIRRETSNNNENNIRISNDNITTISAVESWIEPIDIVEIHDDNELRDLSLSRRQESRHDDRIDSLITGWNIINTDSLYYGI